MDVNEFQRRQRSAEWRFDLGMRMCNVKLSDKNKESVSEMIENEYEKMVKDFGRSIEVNEDLNEEKFYKIMSDYIKTIPKKMFLSLLETHKIGDTLMVNEYFVYAGLAIQWHLFHLI